MEAAPAPTPLTPADAEVRIAALQAELADTRARLEEVIAERDFLQMVNDSLQEGNLSLVESLVLALDARDPYTAGHSLAVAVYARDIAQKIGMPECSVHRVYLAGLVHDIGKIAVPDAVLLKEGKLTEDEFAEIKKHPVVGAEILKPAQGFDDILRAVRHHHERIDGCGYPDQLEGETIPIVARILAVADAYNAMTSKRSYRDAMPVERATSILLECQGAQHDPKLVAALLELLDENGAEYAQARSGEFAHTQSLVEILAKFTMPQECLREAA